MPAKIYLVAATLFLVLARLSAGPYGTIVGRIHDQATGEAISGVNVVVLGTATGAISDEKGRFILTHLLPGRYTLEFLHIGYEPYRIEALELYPEARMQLTVPLTTGTITGDTVTVVIARPLIRTSMTNTTRFVSAAKIRTLPIQSALDVVDLQPGVAAGHVRGGRKNEVVYLVDGIPVMDAISGELAVLLAKDAIQDISIQTGGFNAEHGNAMSAIVNVRTLSGTSEQKLSIRAGTIMHQDQNPFSPKTTRGYNIETTLGGPVWGTNHRYFMSFSYLQNEFARLKESFGERQLVYFDPNAAAWTGLVKFATDPSRSFQANYQALFTYRDWREYEHKWSLNLPALPDQGLRSVRHHVEISQVLTPSTYYTLKVGQLHLMRQIYGRGSEISEPIEFQTVIVPFWGEVEDPSLFIITGDYPRWLDHDEIQTYLRGDISSQISYHHRIKTGLELTSYNLYKKSVVRHQQTASTNPYFRFFVHNTEYEYFPWRLAYYIQDQIDFQGVKANLGLRYDYFNPTASRPALEQTQLSDSTQYSSVWIINYDRTEKASPKIQISPRIGLSIPVTSVSYLRLNYGHFFQVPQFDYLYTNSEYAVVQGFTPIGDPDLKPARTKAYEFGYLHQITEKYVIDIAAFYKESTNLVDVNTYTNQESYQVQQTGVSGLIQYVNVAYSLVRGAELLFKFYPTPNLNGYLSYTYMVARGTSDNALQQYAILADNDLEPGLMVEYDLSWDQRHTLIFHLEALLRPQFRINTIYRLNSPLPYTRYQGVGKTTPNNARMSQTSSLDVRCDWEFATGQSRLTFYGEIMNLLDHRNILWQDRDGLVGGYLQSPAAYDQRRRITLGVNYAR